jgi:hypothetical protein
MRRDPLQLTKERAAFARPKPKAAAHSKGRFSC